MKNLVENARDFAYLAHMGQNRKYTPWVPYIVHPYRVAYKLELLNKREDVLFQYTDEDLAVAYLHDVVEDCGVTVQTLRNTFGNEVAVGVQYLTDPPNDSYPKGTNRAMRKGYTRERLRVAPGNIQSIKLVDVIDNMTDTWDASDHSFLRVFIHEAEALKGVLDKADKRLHVELDQVIAECRDVVGADSTKA